LVNLQRALSQEAGIRVSTDERNLEIGSDRIFDYHLVFLHGRTDFRLTAKQREQLKQYVTRGGMILGDAVCASEAFARAFRREMAAIFPEAPLERIPADHPMFTTEFGGFDLKTVTRRDPQRTGQGGATSNLRKVEPLLEGLRVADHYAVIFSPYDLSCALENHESLECRGYIREDAARIGINVVMYTLHE
jgi:hypothetical protein